jgi:nicotinamide-nucleotide amidase
MGAMTGEIITIGDELLIGQVINTNQAYLAQELNGIGIDVGRMSTVGDEMTVILEAFADAWKRHDLVIVTGGLGPTHDDITKKAVCTFFNTDLVSDSNVRVRIDELLSTRGLQWTQAAEEQALVPRSATVIPNPVGTAPGLRFEDEHKIFLVLPGVPYEMKELVHRFVIPYLTSKVPDSHICHLTLRTTGIPESLLALQLGDLQDILSGATLAFLPSPKGVRLRISAHERSREQAEERVRQAEERIRNRVSTYIYGTGDDELEEVVGRLLTERNLSLSVAESCTGGLLADWITNVSGSSVYFERGIIAYSNRAKSELLGVQPGLITAKGAVSREVAEAMAQGIRTRTGTSIGLSTTGIAGPTGGSPEKPIGLVCIGYADTDGALAVEYNFGTQRRLVKERAAQAALELLRRKIIWLG